MFGNSHIDPADMTQKMGFHCELRLSCSGRLSLKLQKATSQGSKSRDGLGFRVSLGFKGQNANCNP